MIQATDSTCTGCRAKSSPATNAPIGGLDDHVMPEPLSDSGRHMVFRCSALATAVTIDDYLVTRLRDSGATRIEFTMGQSAFVVPDERPDLLEEFARAQVALESEHLTHFKLLLED